MTAKIEVDGEPMMLTRTIRCIKQPRPWAQSFTGASPDDSSVFDALGGLSKSGRTIVINVEKACGRLDLASRRNELPFHLGPTDDGRPPVLEPVGNSYLPDVIYSYTDDALQEGRYGIRLIEVNIQGSAIKSRMFDGGQYDWIGARGWYGGSVRSYRSYFGYELPNDFMAATSPVLREEIKTCHRPCAISLTHKFAANMMLGEYVMTKLEKIPLEFDSNQQLIYMRPEYPGRLTHTNLPVDTNLGRRDSTGSYIVYRLGNEDVRAYQAAPQEYLRFIHPNNDFVLVFSAGQLFYLTSYAVGLNLGR